MASTICCRPLSTCPIIVFIHSFHVCSGAIHRVPFDRLACLEVDLLRNVSALIEKINNGLCVQPAKKKKK